MATKGKYIIVDIQGWKINSGQYIMTDPILFSTRKTPSLRRDQSKVLTNQDWKANEIKDWMDEHLKHCG